MKKMLPETDRREKEQVDSACLFAKPTKIVLTLDSVRNCRKSALRTHVNLRIETNGGILNSSSFPACASRVPEKKQREGRGVGGEGEKGSSERGASSKLNNSSSH